MSKKHPTPQVEILTVRDDQDNLEVRVFIDGKEVTDARDAEDVSPEYGPVDSSRNEAYRQSRITSITDRPDLSDAYKQACREAWEQWQG